MAAITSSFNALRCVVLQVFHSIAEQPWAMATHFELHGCHYR